MHFSNWLSTLVLGLATLSASIAAARKPSDAVLLSNVKTLTLRNGKMTTHRRVPPIPQLQSTGGTAHTLYEIDTMRCRNSGSSYDPTAIEWTCTASLPPEFKLGATDVICEGYDSPDDPYVLKGSCGVRYRLVLTELGELKYGRRPDAGEDGEEVSPVVQSLFWIVFAAVAVWVLFQACVVRGGEARRPETWGRGGRPGGGGGGGGWGPGGGGWGPGGGGNDNDDPPPPYDWQPPRKQTTYGTTTPAANASQGQNWRPGFWSGVLGGAAAGYLAGNRGRQTQGTPAWGGVGGGARRGRNGGAGGGSWWNGNGEGSSGRSSGSGSASPPSTARYESTGFGSTSRR